MTKKTWDEAEKSKEAKGMMGGFLLYESKGGRGLSGREDPPLLGRLFGRREKKKKTRQHEQVEEEKKEHKEEENREKWQTTK